MRSACIPILTHDPELVSDGLRSLVFNDAGSWHRVAPARARGPMPVYGSFLGAIHHLATLVRLEPIALDAELLLTAMLQEALYRWQCRRVYGLGPKPYNHKTLNATALQEALSTLAVSQDLCLGPNSLSHKSLKSHRAAGGSFRAISHAPAGYIDSTAALGEQARRRTAPDAQPSGRRNPGPRLHADLRGPHHIAWERDRCRAGCL
jgi:hypothetical protein